MAPSRSPQDLWEANSYSADPGSFAGGQGDSQPPAQGNLLKTPVKGGSKKPTSRAAEKSSGTTELQTLDYTGDGARGAVKLDQCSLVEPPRQAHLVSVIEGEIIPRLMLIHRGEMSGELAGQAAVTPSMIAIFTDIVQRASIDQALTHIRDLTDHQQIPLQAIFKDLFASTARRLGELWEQDQIDFVEVTIGLSRLQQLLHELAAVQEIAPAIGGRNALIVPTPGDQHTFGSMIVIQMFRDAGWEVSGGVSYSVEELERLVRRQDFALIGFSLASEALISHLSGVIARVRKASRIADMAVVVGGYVSTVRPDLAVAVGADYSVTDPMRAVEFGSNWSDNAQIRPN
jgi:MerR family transcriptional regulator, light-induced transcriptional regulator